MERLKIPNPSHRLLLLRNCSLSSSMPKSTQDLNPQNAKQPHNPKPGSSSEKHDLVSNELPSRHRRFGAKDTCGLLSKRQLNPEVLDVPNRPKPLTLYEGPFEAVRPLWRETGTLNALQIPVDTFFPRAPWVLTPCLVRLFTRKPHQGLQGNPQPALKPPYFLHRPYFLVSHQTKAETRCSIAPTLTLRK